MPFYAAVVFVVVLSTAGAEEQFRDIKQELEKSLAVFEDMAGRSRVCAKATPILRHLLNCVVSNCGNGASDASYPDSDHGLESSGCRRWIC